MPLRKIALWESQCASTDDGRFVLSPSEFLGPSPLLIIITIFGKRLEATAAAIPGRRADVNKDRRPSWRCFVSCQRGLWRTAWRATGNPHVRGPCYPPPVACSPSCPFPPSRTLRRLPRHRTVAMLVFAFSLAPKSLKQVEDIDFDGSNGRKEGGLQKISQDMIICDTIGTLA